MKLLVVMPYYKPAYVYGGPVRSVSTLCEGLAKYGVQVTVMTTNANGSERLKTPLYQPVVIEGVEVIYYPLGRPSLGTFFYSPELIQAAVKRIPEFDLVGLEVMWSSLAYSLSATCHKYHIPYTISLRGQILSWALRKSWLKKQIYWHLIGRRYLNRASALHCTDAVEAQAAAQLGLQAPTFIVPNSVNVSRFEQMPVRGMFRHRLGIPPDAKVLLFLGRLLPIKRPDITIDVLARLRSSFPDTHLILAGPDEGGLWGELQRQAEQLGCADHVHLTGLLQTEEVLQVLADSDLFLMPTEIQENFGMAAAEAMAAGKPIVVSEGIPVGQWAQKAGAGYWLPCNADAFTQAAAELLANPELIHAMGQRGIRLAQEQFDVDATIRQMMKHFQSIIETGHPLGSS